MGITMVASAPTFDDLQRLVHRTLCEYDHLVLEESPLFRSIIRRGNRPCGLFFQVQGPRLLKTYAVWAGDENRVLCYDSAGTRFMELKLSEAPDPQAIAA